MNGKKISSLELMKDALEIASKSDIAIVFAGLSDELESEGWDNPDLKLPYGQDDLIREIARINKNTVVVLFSGIPLNMEKWINDVPAVLQAWYPGQECGNALAAILKGDVNPSGKLPVTFPKRWEDSPAYGNYPGKDGQVEYKEGIMVGYRYFDSFQIEPQFPFGHGLSYTRFNYDSMSATKTNERIVIEFQIGNTGEREGTEIAQLYVGNPGNLVYKPLKELKAFSNVPLKSGEKSELLFR
ncbi:MAG: hypothetical protein HC906_08095 [Bacteroidales bacterium]|nr:hypothetical protein [Bacteroidales bacterium]